MNNTFLRFRFSMQRMNPILGGVLVVCLTVGCNFRDIPAFRRERERQSRLATEATRKAIEQSPELQELDRLCTREIPQITGAKLDQLSKGRNVLMLFYYYSVSIRYGQIKEIYSNYFNQAGWRVTGQKDGGWGPSNIEFQNDRYKVNLVDMIDGDDPGFALECSRSGGN